MLVVTTGLPPLGDRLRGGPVCKEEFQLGILSDTGLRQKSKDECTDGALAVSPV